ncbi:hypothetical protein AURDEDRAFT_126592 [Auricularia subglabra TFB-10046 SS5]|nr:hypothetical protein AURDEDRAFT_126592 [Auricularia subglabra TFB-10046 SS5]
MRMRNFAPFVASDDPDLRHVRCLRVACFWHDDEISWSDYVSSWLELRLPARLAVERLQVYIHSVQNAGSLLQALALHFPTVTALELRGTFAQPPDMSTCLASFPKLDKLRFHWGSEMPRSVLDVWMASPDVQPRPQFTTCWLSLDLRVLPLLAHWTAGKLSWIRGIVLENVEATASRYSRDGNSLVCLLRALDQLSEANRALVRGLHLRATEIVSLKEDCRRPTQRALQMLPRVRSLVISVDYALHAQRSSENGADPSDHDPITMVAFCFSESYASNGPGPRIAFECRSLRRLVVELVVSAKDVALLWHHDWHALDKTFAYDEWSDLRELVIAVCVTDVDEAHDAFDIHRFVKRVLPSCCKQGIVRVRYSEIPRYVPKRKKKLAEGPERPEDGLVQFGRGDFADTEAWSTDDSWSATDARHCGS